jgi:hypothetical protein
MCRARTTQHHWPRCIQASCAGNILLSTAAYQLAWCLIETLTACLLADYAEHLCCFANCFCTRASQVLLGPHSFSSIASRLAELGVRLMLTEGEAAGTTGVAPAGTAVVGSNKQQTDVTRLLSGVCGCAAFCARGCMCMRQAGKHMLACIMLLQFIACWRHTCMRYSFLGGHFLKTVSERDEIN